MSDIKLYLVTLYRRPVLWLSVVAAILYSSWPLGYLLNPVVGKHALASQLEAPHQPYNWVFISMDVLTGVVLLIIGTLQFEAYKNRVMFRLCIGGYILFGILVAVAALMPLNCNPEAGTCGPIIDNPSLIVHGFASIVSVLFLLASVMVLGISVHRHRMSHVARGIIVVVLGCWLIFGLGSLIELALHINNNLLQYYFISLCSFSIIVVVGSIEYLHMNGMPLSDLRHKNNHTT